MQIVHNKTDGQALCCLQQPREHGYEGFLLLLRRRQGERERALGKRQHQQRGEQWQHVLQVTRVGSHRQGVFQLPELLLRCIVRAKLQPPLYLLTQGIESTLLVIGRPIAGNAGMRMPCQVLCERNTAKVTLCL